jgi:SAM-dependent methyltransferase
LIEALHARRVYGRRVSVLSEHLAGLLPKDARVLDVGTGDGYLASRIAASRPDVRIVGVDVLARPKSWIPVTPFDGRRLPFADGSFDAVMFVDVLHHADDPQSLLFEAARVAAGNIVIKDHTLRGLFAGVTLRFMDRVGNARHGVSLPYNYWRYDQWLEAIARIDGTIEVWRDRLGIYWGPLGLLFDRSLHFIARIRIPASGRPEVAKVVADSAIRGTINERSDRPACSQPSRGSDCSG